MTNHITYTGTTSTSKPIVGMMRFNTTDNCMETYDGTQWSKVYTVGNVVSYRLDISEGRVAGARYYTVEPVGQCDWYEMQKWMVETFGETADDGVWTPGERWYANNSKFWFRNRKDLDWFVLRWSS